MIFEKVNDEFLLFKFKSFKESQWLFEEGPWFIKGHLFILRRWREYLTYQIEEMDIIPIWVKFQNLGMSFRSTTGLSKLASCIGKPICMDRFTAEGMKLGFDRVMVEVSVNSKLPISLNVGCRDGMFKQAIEYAWKPNPCDTFNHSPTGCPLSQP